MTFAASAYAARMPWSAASEPPPAARVQVVAHRGARAEICACPATGIDAFFSDDPAIGRKALERH